MRCRHRAVRFGTHPSSGQKVFYAAIGAVTQDQQPDLRVLGIRRRSGVGKLFMGSVTQKILLEIDCPVLVVKTAAHN